MNRVGNLNLLIAAILVVLLAFLIWKTRAVDLDGHNQIIATLRQLKQVDAQWNIEVLKSKTGFNANYDPVAGPLALLESLESALRAKTGLVWQAREGSYARLSARLDSYKSIMEKKIAVVEQFKSQNAILRNSSRFLPVAAAEVNEALKQRGQDDPRKAAMSDALNTVLTGAMNYVVTPDRATQARIEENSSRLKDGARAMSGEIVAQVDVLLRHVAAVVRQQNIGDRLLGELFALPTAAKLDELTDAYTLEHGELLTEQERYRQILIGYSALLLALLGYLGWRLLRSYRTIHRANAELKEANLKLKESQLQLVQSEKMSALGQMVAGIAHEINTPLAYLKGTIELLREQISDLRDLVRDCHALTQMLRNKQRDPKAVRALYTKVDAQTREALETNRLDDLGMLLKDGADGIEQISEIVVNLKNFSRLDRERVAEYSVEEGLEATLLLARNMLRDKEVRVERQYAPDTPRISCSPSQINQVFLNMISNAVQAIGDRAAGVIRLRTLREDDATVRVEIHDNGSGIAGDVLPKIFDPFFTTKDVGQGSGMGLAICYKIVQAHGGKILVESERGIGTVFAILLPVEPPAQPGDEHEVDSLSLAA
jgi:two-component system, NtrC family, sensor kinase